MIVIYMAHDNHWESAMLWAKDKQMKVELVKECCYRMAKRNVDYIYATDRQIITDYTNLGTELISL